MHGGKSTAAKTEEGRRRIVQANLKTGLKSKADVADRGQCRNLTDETKSLIDSVYEKIDLWNRTEEGDEDALLELSAQLDYKEFPDLDESL